HGSGWHLDRRRFDVLLLDQVVASGVDVRRGERFAGCETTAGERRFRFVRSDSSVKTVRARYAVDASGPTAVLARGVGARRLFADRLFCAYGFFQLADSVSLPRLTMLEAVDVGWWYAARLPNREVVVALASDSETVRQFAASDATAWQALLRGTRHIGPALAESTWIEGSLRVAPAPSFVLDRTAGDGWLAAGDAASAYDPISAQGIYKALNDGLLAANAIVADLGGDAAALESYHASVKRRFEQYLVNRNYFYSIERRFPASPFWRRRQH
ncbi:MAG TPA: FAD-dependent monooxygenase, partial [Thermoanaerobaculia bacterium]